MTIAQATLANIHAKVAELNYDPFALGSVEVNRCPVCRTTKRSQIGQQDRYGFRVAGMECGDCGLIYLSPRLTPAGYDDLYTHWYRKLVSLFSPGSLAESQATYGTAVFRALAPYLVNRKGQTLLDVGGSTGVHSAMARDAYGLIPTVLDPAVSELAQADEKGLATYLGTLDDFPAYRQFDVIALFQSVEHVSDPLRTFLQIRNLLTDGGIFIFDHRPFDEQRKQYHPERLLKIDHPIYLSQYAARELIERSGFEIQAFLGITGGHFHYVCKKAARRVADLGHALN